MAALSHNDVLKLAQLARLELSEKEVSSFAEEMNEILGYVEKLQSVDVEGLEPTSQVTGLTNVMRQDIEKSYQAEPTELLATAPAIDGSLIKVKRVL